MACTYPTPFPECSCTFLGVWEGASGLPKDILWPIVEAKSWISSPSSPHYTVPSAHSMAPINPSYPPPGVPFQSATSNSQICGNSFWQRFSPFSSYFKSFHISPRSSMEQQLFTTELALLATLCYVLSHLWLQNKMLLILVSSGDEHVSNASLMH